MRKTTLLAAVALAAGACTTVSTSATAGSPFQASVVNVPDGDSLTVEIEGSERKVRLIGVNAPEYDECYGEQSAAGLRDLVNGKQVTITTDVEATDQYGRLLGYVFVGETFVNEEIVWRGWSLARGYEPNTSRQESIDRAGRVAREQQRGMWAPDACLSPSYGSVAISGIRPNPPGPDEENLNGELVTITNSAAATLDLGGWVLRDGSSVHRYTFPSGTLLEPSAELEVSSGCGVADESHQFWCADGPVWNNSGDSALLLDSLGRVAATYDY